jgi:hypothetical protein
MKKIITITLLAFSTIIGFAQTPLHRTCGTMDYHNYLMQTRPNYATDYTQYNQMLDQYIQNNQASLNTAARTANITIPVVIHVLYNTAGQNISDAQATSQFAVLNNDFQRLNADKVNTPSTFTAVAGGVGITFCLAQRDPNGNATTGIIHKSTTTTSFTTDNKIKSSAQGGDDPWDVTKYINIWIGNISGGILGYGEFPTTTLSNTYGLVLNYTATGTMGTASAPYNLGRTGTHEFGHCFNLNHIWGDNGQCGNTDNCYDTPPQKGGTNSPAGCNYGTPTYPWQPNTCTRPDGIAGASMTNVNGDMFMNYMDYTDDAVMNMFSQQQCVRMLAVVSNPPWNVLASSNGCTPISASGSPVASFSVSSQKCVGSPITFTDLSTNTPTTWSWSFPSGSPSSSTLQNPSVTYSIAGTYTATLLSANSSGTSAAVSQTFMVLAKPTVAVTSATTCSGISKTLTASGASTYSWSTGLTTSTISSTPTTNTSYTVTGTATSGCKNTAVGSITVTALPTIVATSTAVCAGSTAVLTASGASTYSWSTGATTSTISATPTTNSSYTVTGTATTGCKNTAVETVTVTALPTVVAISTAVCAGSTAVLTASGASTYSWSTGATTPTISATPTINTSYTITGTATTGCKNTAVGTVTVTALPTVSVTSTTICAGSVGTLTASGASTYTWSTGTNGVNLVTSPISNTTYTVVGTSIAGCNNSATGSIFVGSVPVISVNSLTICAGSTVTLSASGVNSYTWNTGANTSAIIVNPSSTTVYTVSGNLTGCSTTASKIVTVTVNALPTIVATSTAVCAGSTAILTASGASTYSWSTGAITSTISITSTTNSSYTVTGTATTGCKNTAVGTVTVNALPTIVATSTAVCAGNTAVLTASGASTYSWSTGATTSTISVTSTTNSSYTVTGTVTSGCKNTAVGSVTVTALPTVVATSIALCAGSTAVLTASGASTYSWSTGATTSTISITSTTNSSYTVTGTATSGCKNTAVGTVTVNALPTIVATSTAVCAGSTAILTASGASTYSWSTGATTSTISITSTTNSSYTVTGIATSGCKNTAVGTVTVTALPTVVATSTALCAGSTAVLTASGASTYSWSTGATTSTISVTPTTNTSYTVTGTVTTGCKNIALGNVTVNSLPVVSLAAINQLCTNSSSVVLMGSPANGTYTGTGVSGSTFDPTISGAGTFTVMYYYTNANNCSSSASQPASVSLCTGITEAFNASAISIYPNPTKDIVYVNLNNSSIDNTTIELYDVIGKLVISQKVIDTISTLLITDLVKGIYSIRIITDSHQVIKRIIKE